MKLVIVHSHFRPGGVRRVIEMATPPLVRTLRPGVDEVVLAGGEAPDDLWLGGFRRLLGSTPVTCRIQPELGYFGEQRRSPRVLAQRLRSYFDRLFGEAGRAEWVVWAHNQGLGRNLLLSRELLRACAVRDLRLVLHHHDWWFENRWQRWPEMRRAGCRTLSQVAQTIFASGPNVRHVAISQRDAAVLRRHFRQQVGWLPNPAEPAAPPPPGRVRAACAWLRKELGTAAPVWLMPCRLLRRKNVAEALLLARWLQPGAWLVTTGGASSADEAAYARRLSQAAREHAWPLRLGVLHGDETRKPSVAELLAASEAVVLTSLQEGFGLSYLEAAAARRPLIARRLPNIARDLAVFGFRFPQAYDELVMDPRLFDWRAEVNRQTKLCQLWRRQLPRACRPWAGQPVLLTRASTPSPVPFSRLTLTAQLEVLQQPADESWTLCAPLNPFLQTWRRRAKAGGLQVTPWPRRAARWLSGRAYAARFAAILKVPSVDGVGGTVGRRCFEGFVRERLQSRFLYPLLWSSDT